MVSMSIARMLVVLKDFLEIFGCKTFNVDELEGRAI